MHLQSASGKSAEAVGPGTSQDQSSGYTAAVTFRDKLLASLRAIRPVLELDGVLVIGSEVPNLLQREAASTLVVSQDVDIAVPVALHAEVKRALTKVRGLEQSADEPSVWAPTTPGLIEVNFVGMDPATKSAVDSYVLDDDILPLLVFGHLSLMRPGETLEVEGARVPLPRPAGLMLEKLLSERSGEKGDRDLLVVIGMLLQCGEEDLTELEGLYRRLRPEERHAVRSNLTLLSLLPAREGMPDPAPARQRVATLLRRLECGEPDGC